jgi:hypothetical protein
VIGRKSKKKHAEKKMDRTKQNLLRRTPRRADYLVI